MKLKRPFRRGLAVILAIMMCVGMLGTTAFAAYDKWANWDGNISFREGYPSSWADEMERDGGSITKFIYEDGFYAFRAISQKFCPYCGYHFGDSLGKEYLIYGFGYEYDNAIGVIGDEVGIADEPVLVGGVQAPAITFTAQKLGTDRIWVEFFVNFHSRWNSNSAACPSCWNTVSTRPDDNWYLYDDLFNVTVKARYQLNYDTQGGSSVAATINDTTATSTTLNVTSTVPTKEGYTFKGWAETENGEVKYNGGESITLNWSEGYGSTANPVSKTLYAIWEENAPEATYTVTYTDGVNGETVFPDQSYEGLKDGDTTPAFVGTPEREGYEFMGWAPTVNPVVSADDADEDGEIIYTATWQKDQDPNPPTPPEPSKPTYSISVDKVITSNVEGLEDGGTVDYKVTVTNNGTSTDDKEATLYDVVITDTMDAGLTMIDPENVTAKIGNTPVTLTYVGSEKNAEGKTVYTWEMPGEFAVGATVVLNYRATVSNEGDEEITLNNLAYAKGYTTPAPAAAMFMARAAVMPMSEGDREYVEDDSGTGTGVGGSGSSVVVKPATKYTVTFDSKGGTDVASQTVKKNEKASEPADPTREGWTFEGWYLDSEKYDFNTPVTGDITLTAKWSVSWTPIVPVTYTVTFDSKGGTAVESQTVENGEKAIEPTDPTREGWDFEGWYLGEEKYDFDTPVTGDITLTAKWSVAWTPIVPVTYTVTFDSNGGSAVASQTVENGETATEPANPTRDGYTFNGWTLDGVAYDFGAPVTGDITLVAQWTRNSTPPTPPTPPTPVVTNYTLTINYVDENGVTIADSATRSLAAGATYSVTSPVIEGYTPDQEVVSGTMPADNRTVTVVYTEDENVDDPEPPLAENPEDPDVNIDDPKPPLSEEPDVDIDDPEPPLADAPQTGDSMTLWLAMVAVSGMGLVALAATRQKGKREE